jgi:aspartate aminotransferase-like enzyme
VNDLRGLTAVAHDHGAVICVDAISGLGAVDLSRTTGVDVVIAGSQKALVPARARLRLGQRARDGPGRGDAGSPLLLRLGEDRQGAGEEPPNSPFTPAVTLWRALDVALQLIEDEGFDRALERQAILARRAAGIEAVGLERFGPDNPTPTS